MKLLPLLLLVLLSTPSRAAVEISVADAPEHGLQPRLLVDTKGNLHAVWYTGDARSGDVFHATRNSDKTWSPPVRVNSVPGSAIAAGTIRGAQAALGREGYVHVIWNG